MEVTDSPPRCSSLTDLPPRNLHAGQPRTDGFGRDAASGRSVVIERARWRRARPSGGKSSSSAARDVFATKGYHDAKVDDIVALAKVAKGTFYLYFPDKRSVFSELVDVLFQRLGAAILKVDTGAATSTPRSSTTSAPSSPCSSTIRRSPASSSPTRPGWTRPSSTKIRAFYDGVKAILSLSLTEGQRLGIVAPGDPRLLRHLHGRRPQGELCRGRRRRGPPRPRGDSWTRSSAFLQAGYLRTTRPPSPRRGADPAVAGRPAAPPDPLTGQSADSGVLVMEEAGRGNSPWMRSHHGGDPS